MSCGGVSEGGRPPCLSGEIAEGSGCPIKNAQECHFWAVVNWHAESARGVLDVGVIRKKKGKEPTDEQQVEEERRQRREGRGLEYLQVDREKKAAYYGDRESR